LLSSRVSMAFVILLHHLGFMAADVKG
jgi:hypothetical protein